ncbi:MAG: hypothetical protein KIS92_09145 [Planctomycetota bacterium]|nr:hypothetical protein [Planctomycetota bacterium]
MQIEYCDECQSRITEHDVSVGQAAWFGDKILCKKCMDKQGLKAPPPVMTVRARGGGSSSGILKALPGSGIRKAVGSQPGSGIQPASQPAQPGSGIRAAQPGSGIRAAPGSGILRASTNSGGRLAAQPGSGIRKAATPTSGTRSGIHAATNAGKPPTRAMVRRRRRGSAEDNSVWVSVVTALLTLLVVAGAYLLFHR